MRRLRQVRVTGRLSTGQGANYWVVTSKKKVILKISSWLSRYDDQIFLVIKDKNQRKGYLKKLRQQRVVRGILMLFFVIVALVGASENDIKVITISISFFCLIGMNIIGVDAKIMAIKLYETLTEVDTKLMEKGNK